MIHGHAGNLHRAKGIDTEHLHRAKSIGSCQYVQTSQTDTRLYFLQMHKEPFSENIYCIVCFIWDVCLNRKGDEEFLKLTAAERQRAQYEKMSLEEKLAEVV